MESSILDMQNYFELRMSKFEADLQKKSSSNTASIAEEFAAFKTFVLQTLKSFSQQLSSVVREVDVLEMRSRRKIVLLHGVKESEDEDIGRVVTDIIKQHVKINTFSATDVRRCHRMGRKTSNVKPRPVLVKFQSHTVKDTIWSSKSKLKGTGVTVSEFLTKARHKVFMAARDKFGINKCWTKDGTVYVLSPSGNRHRVASFRDIDSIKCSDDEGTTAATAPTIFSSTATRSKRTACKK